MKTNNTMEINSIDHRRYEVLVNGIYGLIIKVDGKLEISPNVEQFKDEILKRLKEELNVSSE